MRIGIAARGLSGRGGPKQYIESLLTSLLKVDTNNEYFFFYDSSDFIGKFQQAKEIVLNSSSKLVWDYYLLPKTLKQHDLDVMFFPKNVLPFYIPCKSTIVIHDLAHFVPGINAYPLIDTIYMQLMIRSSVKRADHIIAVSENTKRDIIRFTGIPEDKISVIHEAPDGKYRRIIDMNELNIIKNKYKLKEKFIFSCDSITPRKNTIRLLKSFDSIKDRIPHMLVLTGGVSWKSREVHDLIESMKDRVIKLGYIPDEEMPILYNLADLFVYPSLYEGFGLPLLEAMACGCPVVSSNSSSIPEVAGGAGIMFDAYDVAGMAKAMRDVLTDEDLRKDMIKKGIERASQFTWEKCAKETVKILEQIVEE